MKKKNLKEIIIILLLCLAIILILAVIFYGYMPNNITLPEKVSYTTPQEVTQALVSSGGIDDSEVILTYEVDSQDMNNYERINSYNPGKTNPFAAKQIETSEENKKDNNNASGNNNSSGNNTSSGNISTGNEGSTKPDGNTNDSGGTTESNSNNSGYVQDKGTK